MTRLVNRLSHGIIIVLSINDFQDLHIVWYVALMFTNHLSDIKVSENKTG